MKPAEKMISSNFCGMTRVKIFQSHFQLHFQLHFQCTMQNIKKILVVDDEKDCCDTFHRFFTRRGHHVDVAYDGKKAKDLLEYNSYDYIFFDCNMPEISGIELVKFIDVKNPQAQKIMISGYDGINKEFTDALNIDLFFKKPISLEDIQRVVET